MKPITPKDHRHIDWLYAKENHGLSEWQTGDVVKIIISKVNELVEDRNKDTRKLFEDLYTEIAHGDQEHRAWLKEKIETFLKERKL